MATKRKAKAVAPAAKLSADDFSSAVEQIIHDISAFARAGDEVDDREVLFAYSALERIAHNFRQIEHEADDMVANVAALPGFSIAMLLRKPAVAELHPLWSKCVSIEGYTAHGVAICLIRSMLAAAFRAAKSAPTPRTKAVSRARGGELMKNMESAMSGARSVCAARPFARIVADADERFIMAIKAERHGGQYFWFEVPNGNDGPVEPNSFRWQGDSHQMRPQFFLLVNALWNSRGRRLSSMDVVDAVWSGDDPSEKTLANLPGKLTEWFDEHKLPFSCESAAGWFSLKQHPERHS